MSLRSFQTEGADRILFPKPLPDLIADLSDSRELQSVWQFIEQNYQETSISLGEAAKAIGISKNHLNVRLKRATGFTFHKLLIRYRLSRAIAMMEERSWNILEIAMENGFGSMTAFERHFRTLIGTQPRDFRRGLEEMKTDPRTRIGISDET